MLSSLTLSNFSLAVNTTAHFEQGFTVLTGETGAGKSLLMQGLSVAIGGRSEASLVRIGTEKADVTAIFDAPFSPSLLEYLQEKEIDCDDSLILRRVITKEGRSKAFINGVSVPIAELKKVGEQLVHLYSQHSQQLLLGESFAREWLDKVAHLTDNTRKVGDAYKEWQKRESTLKQALAQTEMNRQKLHLLYSYVEEFVPIATHHYATLENEYDTLSDFEHIMQRCAEIEQGIDSEDSGMLSNLASLIKKAENEHKASVFGSVAENLQGAYTLIYDALAEIQQFASKQNFDPTRYQWLDEQLAEFHRLARKHRLEPHELNTRYQQWQTEIEQLELQSDDEKLTAWVESAKQYYFELATALEAQREQQIQPLIDALTKQVKQLSLPEACFEFKKIDLLQPANYGLFDYQLYFSANKGMPVDLLAKVASGGELSRIALVMNTLASQQNEHAPLLVFDEIDVGISGATAEVVGNLLADMSHQQQLICITHQPQVAVQGHHHLLVEKFQTEPASSELRLLSEDERINALAKMSGGVEITDEVLAHVKKLRQSVLSK